MAAHELPFLGSKEGTCRDPRVFHPDCFRVGVFAFQAELHPVKLPWKQFLGSWSFWVVSRCLICLLLVFSTEIYEYCSCPYGPLRVWRENSVVLFLYCKYGNEENQWLVAPLVSQVRSNPLGVILLCLDANNSFTLQSYNIGFGRVGTLSTVHWVGQIFDDIAEQANWCSIPEDKTRGVSVVGGR